MILKESIFYMSNLVALSLVALLIILATVLISDDSIASLSSNQLQAQEKQDLRQQNTTAFTVKAGGGNATAPLTLFVPQNIEIEAGQAIKWYNPTTVAEPHSVTMMKDVNLFPPFAAPFAVPKMTEFTALIPNPNVEPAIVPSNETSTKSVIVYNARAYDPTVIDSTGTKVTYLPPNANYSMDGTESYINSGWIWPEGQVPPGVLPITSFAMTFEKPGNYEYVCTIHPWMTGTVTVR